MNCEINRCRGQEEVFYLTKWICEKHWIEVCTATAPEQEVKIK